MVSTIIRCFIFILFSLTVQVKSQFCRGLAQYNRCSPNSACACFDITGAMDTGICTDEFVHCSELVACESSNNLCYEPNHRCVHHPRCHDFPVCYPVPSFNKELCPLMAMANTTNTISTATTATTSISTTTKRNTQQLVIPNIPANAQWTQNGVTVAGGHGSGDATNQLRGPQGLFVDGDDQTVVIADVDNHRIIQWKRGDTNGQVVAGGNGGGNGLNQLYEPTNVLIHKETDSLIICDQRNRRVVRWSRRSNTTDGEILIDNIQCRGLAMDDQRYLYISDTEKHEVRRYQIEDKNETIVAGGNGQGNGPNQLNRPSYVFVDHQQSVYVSDRDNHRVMKWDSDATAGILVAGGQGQGDAVTQLASPKGLFVDTLDTVYVADDQNNRVMRWPKGATQGKVIMGGNGSGGGANQFMGPQDLSYDRDGNIYVVEWGNNRVQRFAIE